MKIKNSDILTPTLSAAEQRDVYFSKSKGYKCVLAQLVAAYAIKDFVGAHAYSVRDIYDSSGAKFHFVDVRSMKGATDNYLALIKVAELLEVAYVCRKQGLTKLYERRLLDAKSMFLVLANLARDRMPKKIVALENVYF